MDADVIVIGAGAAGLAAARGLAGRSFRTLVLEARDRTGGRVWTGPATRSGVPAELGAEFIHGPAPETRALLREAGTARVDTGGEGWAPGPGGELRPYDRFGPSENIFEGVRTLAEDESVERFLQRFDADPSMRDTVADVRGFVEGFDAADPALASVRGIAAEWESGVDDVSARPIGGYRPMFERLEAACDALGVVRRLSTVVRGVTWRRGGVTVEATDAAGADVSVSARAAVVTLPAGVLRRAGGEGTIAFDPPLPAAKRAALEYLLSGDAVKVALWFTTAFWEDVRGGRYRDAGFFRRSGQTFTAYWTQMPIRAELINAWAGGPRATALSALSQAELMERAVSGFGTLLGEPALARREFEGGIVHDWHHDPFARGAYSYLAVGGGDARVTLGEPVDDTLFFAGEALANDGQGGTVNGALHTGERAAREAASRLVKAS